MGSRGGGSQTEGTERHYMGLTCMKTESVHALPYTIMLVGYGGSYSYGGTAKQLSVGFTNSVFL